MFVDDASGRQLDFELTSVILGGYTGRDQARVREHIDELAEHGVPAPARVPSFYRVTPRKVVAADSIDVLGPETSGEAELILLRSRGELFVGLGSDHTDRGLERQSVRYAKQVCPKVVCPRVWRYAEIASRWNCVRLRSFAGTERRPYQDAPVTAILDPEDILARVTTRMGRGLEGVLVFSGTVPLLGQTRFPNRFAAELCDQGRDARLSLDYAVNVIDPLD